jgi:hypothetical protein
MALFLAKPPPPLPPNIPRYDKEGRPLRAQIEFEQHLVQWLIDLASGGSGLNAPAGQIGESLYAAQSTPVSLVSGAAHDIVTLALPPGDWDVDGEITLGGSSTSVTDMQLWTNSASVTRPAANSFAFTHFAMGQTGQTGASMACGPARISSATGETIYLSAQIAATSGTLTATGAIRARRMR